MLQGRLEVRYVSSSEQLANYLIKPLTHSQFHYLRNKLGLVVLPSRLRRDIEDQKVNHPSDLDDDSTTCGT